jgi:hypothetical protein
MLPQSLLQKVVMQGVAYSQVAPTSQHNVLSKSCLKQKIATQSSLLKLL